MRLQPSVAQAQRCEDPVADLSASARFSGTLI